MDLQKLTHLEISTTCLEVYQLLDAGNTKRKNKSFVIRVINPIQLLTPSSD
jgi:hypothetical protein